MPLWLMLAVLAAAVTPATSPRGAIEATIRGTDQPLDVELLLRDAGDGWKSVEHQRLPPATRRARFDGLESGMYQILLRGSQPTEQLGTKIAIGRGDMRRVAIAVKPFTITGRVTFGETSLGAGVLVLQHGELRWRAPVALAADGTFLAPLWQRGAFTSVVRSPALTTEFTGTVDLDGKSPVVSIEIPQGRIRGIVRDAKSGAPVPGATVALQTKLEGREENATLTTGPEGRFDFVGLKYGRHTVNILPPQHLRPEPIVFTLSDDARLREIDAQVEPGREIAVLVIDADNDPVENAKVLAVTESQLRGRTTTDHDGRATVAVPAGEASTLFVIPEEGPFGMQRVPRDQEAERLKLYLPRVSSSLLIRALTTNGATMPPFSLLMRYNGELVPPEVAEELTEVQGLQLTTGPESEALLRNIPSGSYEFWPYRTDNEAEAIVASAPLLAPIQVNVRTGENLIAVKFAARR